MDENTKKPEKITGSGEPDAHSAFKRRDKPASSGDTTEVPIPSQPRSFSPVRPQRNAVPRKSLTTPTAGSSAAGGPGGSGASAPVNPKVSEPAKPSSASNTGNAPAGTSRPAGAVPKVGGTLPAKPAATTAKPAASTGSTSSFPRGGSGTATPASGTASVSGAGTAATTGTAAATGAAAASSTTAAAPPPQSSGAGGDTIRLRVQPRQHARTLNTAPGRGLRRRLPDIRQVRAAGGGSSANYGPFSLLFGFLWLIFKMIFFTALVLGLGAMIGFMVMTEYIKTPEVTVPNVSGMKIDEAFEVLSDKELGVIKLRTESSGLVAPGEIISQQPPAGASAKVNTDVGVVISSGRSQFVVPDVVGETRENAVNKIRGARLEVGNILTLEDNSVPAGSVISQTPLGDTGTDEAVKVDLMVSAGPPGKSLNMPDLTGKTVIEAKAALKAVGIENVVTEPADAPLDAKVTGQSPLVSKTIFQTDKVTLTISDE